MAVRVWPLAPSRESRSAEHLKNALLASEPHLAHPDIAVEIISDIYLPERQIDLVVLYHDKRSKDKLLKTGDGRLIHSFALVIEVKNHTPDNVRFQGASLSVCYDDQWSNATYQCDQQTYAFKRFQAASWSGGEKLRPIFVQRAIWLTRTPKSSIPHLPSESSVPVHFQGMNWEDLVNNLNETPGQKENIVRAFFDSQQYHNIETLMSKLTDVIVPTKIDLDRINTLTKKKFNDQEYVKKLGKQLLLFRGRGGTGKTIALIQVGLLLSKRDKKKRDPDYIQSRTDQRYLQIIVFDRTA